MAGSWIGTVTRLEADDVDAVLRLESKIRSRQRRVVFVDRNPRTVREGCRAKDVRSGDMVLRFVLPIARYHLAIFGSALRHSHLRLRVHGPIVNSKLTMGLAEPGGVRSVERVGRCRNVSRISRRGWYTGGSNSLVIARGGVGM